MKIAIIGAGLSGLTLAHKLKNLGEITIIEKSRGVAGRMSTRRAGDYRFDHGTQHFTIRDPKFMEFLKPLFDKKIIKPWVARFSEIDNFKITFSRIWSESTNNMHYVGCPNMNSICKELAAMLEDLVEIRLNCKAEKIISNNNSWEIIDIEGNSLGKYDWIFSAIPAEQAFDLLPKNFEHIEKVEETKMSSCFSLMLALNKKLDLGWDAAVVKNSIISWATFCSSKPDRKITKDKSGNEVYCYLITARNKWSEAHIDDDILDVTTSLKEEAQKLMNFNDDNILHQDIQKWRYANISKNSGDQSLIDNKNKIGVCGDWLIQGRVEAAFLSANDLARKLGVKSHQLGVKS